LHEQLRESIYQQLTFSPTEEQAEVIEFLTEFTFLENDRRNCLIFKGFAGTGKTSVSGSYVKALRANKLKFVLLAPTGRAAKVFYQNSDFPAYTIHKFIYRRKTLAGGSIVLEVAPNLRKNCVFLVDEASMIGDFSMQNDGTISSRNLLDDLLEYVFQNASNKLVFIGDEGQLPPVGSDFSPTLNIEYLQNHFFGVNFYERKLTKVMRQTENSLILTNATKFRQAFDDDHFPKLLVDPRKDVRRIDGSELQEELENAYNNFGQEETIFITRSNKRANYFNLQIRNRILWYDEDLCKGDSLMVVKNSYFWLEESSPMGFIANGEMFRIVKTGKRVERYGHHYIYATILFDDYEEIGELEVLLFLDLLLSDSPSFTRNEMKELFFAIEEDYSDIGNKKKRYEKIMQDPFFNALQVKFAYAVTCHKSQGGQWDVAFIDHGYIEGEFRDPTFNRWLYTAFTRAKKKLFLVGFDERFFSN